MKIIRQLLSTMLPFLGSKKAKTQTIVHPIAEIPCIPAIMPVEEVKIEKVLEFLSSRGMVIPDFFPQSLWSESAIKEFLKEHGYSEQAIDAWLEIFRLEGGEFLFVEAYKSRKLCASDYVYFSTRQHVIKTAEREIKLRTGECTYQ